jgi:hypothetical protein
MHARISTEYMHANLHTNIHACPTHACICRHTSSRLHTSMRAPNMHTNRHHACSQCLQAYMHAKHSCQYAKLHKCVQTEGIIAYGAYKHTCKTCIYICTNIHAKHWFKLACRSYIHVYTLTDIHTQKYNMQIFSFPHRYYVGHLCYECH